jgi:hypothetical protein
VRAMTKKQLLAQLKLDKIPNHFYSLKGGLPYDAWCLAEIYPGWEVYYSEKGGKYQIKLFQTENEACNHIYQKLKEMMEYL